MAIFDELADQQRDRLSKHWIFRAFDSQKEIADFVARERSGGKAEGIVSWFSGSYNFCFRVRFDDGGPDAVIRFPKPGCTTFCEEKITNEARVIEFIIENTTIPVPRLISWGLTKDSPQQLGPFLISEFIDGVSLSDVLRDKADFDRQSLSPSLDERTLDAVYEQIADIMLQLFQFNFHQIGAISKDLSSNTWSVSERPLTNRMNELVTAAFFPTDKFPTAPFASAKDYFQSLALENIINLQTQRNIATNRDRARELYLARHRFVRLVDKFYINNHGPFKLFCDDFRPHNILVNPVTLQITAVIDLEFTNVMPSQFAMDPPWWLLLAEPESYLSLGNSPGDFLTAFELRLNQFLQAVQRVEKARGLHHANNTISSGMRDAWNTKRFWFNYAARNPFDIETVCAAFIKDESNAIEELLDEQARSEIESFVQMKMEQLKAYDRECELVL